MPNRYLDHRTSIRLGCEFVVVEATEGLEAKALRSLEDSLIEEYRAKGLNVVNPTNREIFVERGKRARVLINLDKEQNGVSRLELGRRKITKEDHQKRALKRIETQRANLID